MAIAQAQGGYLERPRPSGLADVVDVILDKGLVIDAYVRVSLIGIEILTIDARIVVASVDTYLRFAEAVNRMDIGSGEDAQGLPELMESVTSGGAKSKTQGALEGVKEKLFGGDDEDEQEKEKEKEKQESRPRSRASSSGSRSRSSSSSRRSSSGGSSRSGSSRSKSSSSKSSGSRSRSGSSKGSS